MDKKAEEFAITSLILGGLVFNVEVLDRIRDNNLGESSLSEEVMRLYSGMSEQGKTTTLLHEALHMPAAMNGLNFEEGTIQCLETALYSLLVNNPQFTIQFLKRSEELGLIALDVKEENGVTIH